MDACGCSLGLGFISPSPARRISASNAVAPAASVSLEATRSDFPILNQTVNGHKLIYLDNAATSQKPMAVLDKEHEYNSKYNSNVHRGIHALSAKATEEYEISRIKVANFINAETSREIVFTRNATEAINLVAFTWGLSSLQQGDEILLSVAEHHSNIVPWQIVAQRTGAALKFVSLSEDETLDLDELKASISKKTKLISLHHVSNMLGSVNPVREIVQYAHEHGAMVLVDACQSVPHMAVDVRELGVDFLVLSSHKMCGPTGLGVLYGRFEILMAMPPFMGGGEMISDVFLDHSTYADPPLRFEAGTPAIAQAIGLGAAIDYLSAIGMDRIHEYEMVLSKYLYDRLSSVSGVRIYGPKFGVEQERAALCSFNVQGIHPSDLSMDLDQQHGVAVRSGHHCTQPLHRHLAINASARASLYFYNTVQEVDAFIDALNETIAFFTSRM